MATGAVGCKGIGASPTEAGGKKTLERYPWEATVQKKKEHLANLEKEGDWLGIVLYCRQNREELIGEGVAILFMSRPRMVKDGKRHSDMDRVMEFIAQETSVAEVGKVAVFELVKMGMFNMVSDVAASATCKEVAEFALEQLRVQGQAYLLHWVAEGPGLAKEDVRECARRMLAEMCAEQGDGR